MSRPWLIALGIVLLSAVTSEAIYAESLWTRLASVFRAKAAPLRITNTPLPVGATAMPYAATLAATGGKPPYSWSATGLPAGFTLSAGGALTGMSAVVVNALPTFIVRDRTGGQNSLALMLAICAPLKITVTEFPQETINVPFVIPLTAAGGGGTVALPPLCNP